MTTKEIIMRIENLGFVRNSSYDHIYNPGTEYEMRAEAWKGYNDNGEAYVILVSEDILEAWAEDEMVGSYDEIEDLLSDIGFEAKMTEETVADFLNESFQYGAINGQEISRCESFAAAGLLTHDDGIVITLANGQKFQITVKEV